MTAADLLVAALAYARRGIPVFPCAADKRPTTPHGFHDATTDEVRIRAWWSEHPDALIGIPTGAASGLWALDVDRRNGIDGHDALDRLTADHGALPETAVSLTAGGGMHYVFTATEPVACSAGRLGPGLDVRGDGGYIIAPPSRANGRAWEWEASSGRPAAAPEWLLELVRPPQRAPPRSDSTGPGIRQGQRNATLTREAGKLRRAGMDADVIEAALGAINRRCDPPLETRELRAIAQSVARYAPDGRSGASSTGIGKALYLDPPDVETFLASAFPEQESIIGPIRTQQIAMCASATGVGKTHLGIGLADAVTRGGVWARWSAPLPRGVLLIDGEMPGRLLQERLRLYPQEDRKAPLKIVNAVNWAASQGLPHPNLADPEWQAVIDQWAERSGLEFLIVDNVMSLVSIPNVSVNHDEFWKPIYDWSLRQRAAGRTVLFLDHTNAAGQVFGTKTKLWCLDLCFTLETPSGHTAAEGCRFTVRFSKTRGLYGETVRAFEATLMLGEHGDAIWASRLAEDADREKARELRDEGLSLREIGEELGVSKTTVHRLLKGDGRP